MKKDECERAIRQLIVDWAKETGFSRESGAQPSFLAFKAWALSKGYGQYLKFRSATGADYDAYLWFDQELGQTWRR